MHGGRHLLLPSLRSQRRPAVLTPPLPAAPAPPQVPRLRTAVLGMGHLPATLPPTVERLGVVGAPTEAALAQAYEGLHRLLPQLPGLKELRVTSGQDLPDALAALLPPGCQFSTAGVPAAASPTADCWGRNLHQTAPVSDCAGGRLGGWL